MPGHDLSAARWRKSSCSDGDCVEMADNYRGIVPIRDSKVPDGDVVVVPARAWAAFVADLRR